MHKKLEQKSKTTLKNWDREFTSCNFQFMNHLCSNKISNSELYEIKSSWKANAIVHFSFAYRHGLVNSLCNCSTECVGL